VAVSITERGSQKIEGGLLQVKQSGENLRELSNIVKDNSSAVRQIAAAVSQQNAGITQIFSAVTDQTRMMDETMRRLETTTQAASTLKELSQRVSEVVGQFRVYPQGWAQVSLCGHDRSRSAARVVPRPPEGSRGGGGAPLAVPALL